MYFCVCIYMCVFICSVLESIEGKSQPFLMKIFEINLKKQTHLCNCVNISTHIFRCVYIYITWRRVWQPTPGFVREESPRTEEPGELPSTGSQRVGHNWATKHSTYIHKGLPLWLGGENPTANAGNTGSIPEVGRSPGEGKGYPLQYSCLENSMDRGGWQTAVLGVAKESDIPEPLNINSKHIHDHWTLFLEDVSFEWKGDNIRSSLGRLFWPHYVR